MTLGVDVLVEQNNPQVALTMGAIYNKFKNTVQGIYIGHHGTASFKVLVNFTLITTKEVVFGNTMLNILEYFKNVEHMNLEPIHPDKDVISQF